MPRDRSRDDSRYRDRHRTRSRDRSRNRSREVGHYYRDRSRSRDWDDRRRSSLERRESEPSRRREDSYRGSSRSDSKRPFHETEESVEADSRRLKKQVWTSSPLTVQSSAITPGPPLSGPRMADSPMMSSASLVSPLKRRSTALNPDSLGPRVKALYHQWKKTSENPRLMHESERFLESFLVKSAEIRQVSFELGRRDADYFNFANQQEGILETRLALESLLSTTESVVDNVE